ncbi:hypothetical protein E0I26_08495 [Flavobacterium rhamnosiphilum]|uniref:Uncharacterized protein n=1 Tax=Flavobacterium rhamnosiphilum TaxID=2541724 RepID=A0A4R5F7W5_9FLAO|nr:hypothetical protein [Flavobacterium rhamnosiphilum]TDE44400.1 hypothetical protein E0I26_08495 [Flavobacterium rhamnosiphilum]
MLFQVLLNFIAFIIKCIVWFVFVLAAIPFGIYMLLNKMFPVFTQDAGFWFWSVFSILSIIGFIVLWRPIMWIVGVLQVLGAGAE